jgi:mRNA interferase MazF
MFERGELLLVPFPFSDLSATKRRPVLALTAPDGYGDFIALPVTSRPRIADAVSLRSTDLVRGELPALSWIRTDRVITLSATLVIKSVGRVADDVVDRAVKEFCARIGYPA